MNERWASRRRLVLGMIGLALAAYSLWTFRSLVAYLLVAVALSFIGRPLVLAMSKIQIGKRQMPNGIIAATVLCVFLIAIGAFVLLFAPLFVAQAEAIKQLDMNQLQQLFTSVSSWLDDDLAAFDFSGSGQQNSAYLFEQLKELIQINGVGSLFGGVISGIGNGIIAAFSIAFMTFFFLKDGALFKNIVLALTPDDKEEQVKTILNRTARLLTRYFGGLILQILIITVLVSTGLAVLGVKHAFLIGLLAGVFNLVPYIGPIFGTLLGLTLVAGTFQGNAELMSQRLGWAVVVFALAQAVDNFFTQPVIFSNRVNAHPLEVFLVISIAGTWAGPAGMVLAIPAYTLFRIVAKEWLGHLKVIDRLTKSL
jgi:predicted PurR-regulated permease PerM